MFKTYYNAKLKAWGISLIIGLSGLIEAHGARDRAKSTKCTALYRLRFIQSPLSHPPRIARLGCGAHAHKLRTRARVAGAAPISVKRIKARGPGQPPAAGCVVRRPPPCASDSVRA